MTKAIREDSESMPRPRSNASCYLCTAFACSLSAALLGAVFQERAVWAAGLAVCLIICVQAVCVYYFSRDLPRMPGTAHTEPGPLTRTVL